MTTNSSRRGVSILSRDRRMKMKEEWIDEGVALAREVQRVCLHGHPPIATTMKIASACTELADRLEAEKARVAKLEVERDEARDAAFGWRGRVYSYDPEILPEDEFSWEKKPMPETLDEIVERIRAWCDEQESKPHVEVGILESIRHVCWQLEAMSDIACGRAGSTRSIGFAAELLDVNGLKERLAEARALIDDYAQTTAQLVECGLQLPWGVMVNASGGWKVLARFADEASAWEYAKKQIEARVAKGGECRGHKDGYKQGFHECDKTGPCAGSEGERDEV